MFQPENTNRDREHKVEDEHKGEHKIDDDGKGERKSEMDDNFDLPVDKPKIFLFVGKPASGKSFAMKSILYDYLKTGFFKFGYAFVATKFNHDYDFLPDKLVNENYSDQNLQKYINHLKKHLETHRTIPPNFLILDDLLGKINFYDPGIQHFLSTFRHTNTYIFLSSQYLGAGSSTALREYANYVFMWKSQSFNSIDMLYNSFGKFANSNHGKIFENRDHFVEVLNDATSEEHRCLLCENVVNKPAGFHYWKADECPEFNVNKNLQIEHKRK